jgi:hypothetical protein
MVPTTITGMAPASGNPAPRLNTARYAAIIIRSPWAKLMSLRIPNTMARPTAISAYRLPALRAFTTCWIA